MNRAVIFGVAGAIALGGAWVLFGGSNEHGANTAPGASGRGQGDSGFHARDTGNSMGGDTDSGGHAKAGASGSSTASAAGDKSGRLQPVHPPGPGAAGSTVAGGQPIVEEQAAPSDVLAAGDQGGGRLAPKNKPPVGEEPTDGQAGSAPAAPAQPLPEVAYDSGVDKRFSTVSRSEVPDTGKIGGPNGTVSLWVKPQWGEANQEDASFVELGDSGMHMVKNVNFMRFQYIDPDGKERGLGFNIGDWKDGEWHQVTGTWNNGRYYLYGDGKLISQESFPKPPDFQDETKVYIGTQNANGVPGANSEVSGVQILNRTLSTSEIQAQFNSNTKPRN